MSKDLKQHTNFKEESPHQTSFRMKTDCKEDEFQKGKTNIHIDNQVPLSLNDKYEIKGSDQNKEMFKDLKGEQVKSIQLSHTSDRKFNEIGYGNKDYDYEFI